MFKKFCQSAEPNRFISSGSTVENSSLFCRNDNGEMMNCVRLHSGAKMPLIGLGTLQSTSEEVRKAVEMAIDIGYRHIDTAFVYGNEKDIGAALKKAFDSGKVQRSDMFITTKLHVQYLHKEDVVPMLEQQLKNLGLSYVDLYLVHAPLGVKKEEGKLFPVSPNGRVIPDVVDHMETWSGMEEAYKKGLAKHIGVSNYSVSQLQHLYDLATVKPHNLQCELHPYWPQNELYALCNRLSIGMTSYGSIGRPGAKPAPGFEMKEQPPVLIEDPVVVKIAQKYNKSPAQILLRWVTQRGICVIPKSSNEQRLKQNFDILNFTLEDRDIEALSHLPIRQKLYSTQLFEDHPQKPADGDPY